MRYPFLLIILLALACNTSSSEKEREMDSVKTDGTRLVDTLPPGTDSVAIPDTQ